MTAEKQPNMFIVVAKGMKIIGESECVFMSFDEAKEAALAFRKENDTPCQICMLSSLTGDITPKNLDRSKTIVALLIGLIALIAQFANVQITEGELEQTLDTILKIGEVVAFLYAYLSGKKELGTDIFGGSSKTLDLE